ncbi:DUF5988 family protein [Streptomyces formicae]|uniref:Uncharacterized protein n=1 Tax=Streptomyces formicae TaxID=1616117 RepID=A0ABY3WRJ7_9ACTN|nr:DUF5988 family protein [Streptomyces formicae]UNM13131.1 hypothetical protein J4032_17975 [Streptomyces formicae]
MGTPHRLTQSLLIALEGGPPEVPDTVRVQTAARPEKVAVAYYGRHEHYEFTGCHVPVQDGTAPLYRWTYSTKIAE